MRRGGRTDVDPASAWSAFRQVPRTGVIYVTTEAARLGFDPADPGWCNLGQGMPDAGPLPGAPPRVERIEIAAVDQEYAPVAGLWELREAVAALYNRRYRRGMGSRYAAENVAISGGGRAALTRAAAALGQINLGHFLPDYTAYEELLDVFRMFSPIPILLEPERAYTFSAEELRREILGRGLGAVLFSNPCNPTGKVVGGEALAGWVDVARDLDCAMLIDEFYAHYVWRPELAGDAGAVSAARFVEDVDRDPVLMFDGLTKNWRYPGWRVTWTVGPRRAIEAITAAGSFLDGGGGRPLQRAAVALVDEDATRAEVLAIQAGFGAKRARMLAGLAELGLRVDLPPDGTFYVWASLEGLPPGLDDGMDFFRAALAERVITVPGAFFGVDPGRRRARASRFHRHVRFSFGPPQERIDEALARLARVIAAARG